MFGGKCEGEAEEKGLDYHLYKIFVYMCTFKDSFFKKEEELMKVPTKTFTGPGMNTSKGLVTMTRSSGLEMTRSTS